MLSSRLATTRWNTTLAGVGARVCVWDAADNTQPGGGAWLVEALPEGIWRAAVIAGHAGDISRKPTSGASWAAGVTRAALTSASRADLALDAANRQLHDPQVNPAARRQQADVAVADVVFTNNTWNVTVTAAGAVNVWVNIRRHGWIRSRRHTDAVHTATLDMLADAALRYGASDTGNAVQEALLDSPERWQSAPVGRYREPSWTQTAHTNVLGVLAVTGDIELGPPHLETPISALDAICANTTSPVTALLLVTE